MHSFTLLSTALVMVLQVANALTLMRSGALPIPADVTHIAHDERTGNYLAFKRDGSFYGRYSKNELASIHGKRDGSNCIPLTLADAEKMPGWNDILDSANTSWGNGKRNIVVNPPEYTDYPATVCTSDQPIPVQVQGGQSNCAKSQEKTQGELVGTNGSVTLTASQGYTNTADWSVAQTSSFGIDTTLSADFDIPDILSIGAEVTTSANFENTRSNGFTTGVDQTGSQSLTLDSPEGETCYATMDVDSCSILVTASLQQTATGWVWFNYDSQVMDTINGQSASKRPPVSTGVRALSTSPDQ
ncbi:hypothetical protein BD779DRAFT_1118359 [Infundibulicybe gibba]|nr:hypothetical protein BD779DRAFT_1118359 [Infundibulicybe gibba]